MPQSRSNTARHLHAVNDNEMKFALLLKQARSYAQLGEWRAASLELRAGFDLILGDWAYAHLNALVAQAEFMQDNFEEASNSAYTALDFASRISPRSNDSDLADAVLMEIAWRQDHPRANALDRFGHWLTIRRYHEKPVSKL